MLEELFQNQSLNNGEEEEDEESEWDWGEKGI